MRSTSVEGDVPFFVALKADQITLEELTEHSIDKGLLTAEKAAEDLSEATQWLAQSSGRQWVRLHVEDQTNAQMTAFKSDNNAKLHGIDFDDYILDIRSIDVGFKLPRLGIECATQQQ